MSIQTIPFFFAQFCNRLCKADRTNTEIYPIEWSLFVGGGSVVDPRMTQMCKAIDVRATGVPSLPYIFIYNQLDME